MREEEIAKVLHQCVIALKELHPIMDPDEPCICFKAYESAQQALALLRGTCEHKWFVLSKHPGFYGHPAVWKCKKCGELEEA